MSQLHTCFKGKVVEIRDTLEWGRGRMWGCHQFSWIRFVSHGFGTRGCLVFGLYSSWLRSCCGFRLDFFNMATYLVVVTSDCLGPTVIS